MGWPTHFLTVFPVLPRTHFPWLSQLLSHKSQKKILQGVTFVDKLNGDVNLKLSAGFFIYINVDVWKCMKQKKEGNLQGI